MRTWPGEIERERERETERSFIDNQEVEQKRRSTSNCRRCLIHSTLNAQGKLNLAKRVAHSSQHIL